MVAGIAFLAFNQRTGIVVQTFFQEWIFQRHQ
jgi:hypothetical protein